MAPLLPRRRLLLGLVLVLALAAEDAQGRSLESSFLRARSGLRRGGDDGDERPTCNCACCNVQRRRPDEVTNDVTVKCQPADQQGNEVCGDACSPRQDDHVLAAATGSEGEGEPLIYANFCMFECKPVEGVAAAVMASCVDLDEADKVRIVGDDGNVKDPAFLYRRPTNKPHKLGLVTRIQANVSRRASASQPGMVAQQPPMSPKNAALLAANTRAATEWALPDSVAPADAMKAASTGWTLANNVASETMVEKHVAEAAEHVALATPIGYPEDPYIGIADITGAADNAAAHAKRAAVAAKQAQDAVLAAQAANWRIALATAQEQIKYVETQVRNEELLRGPPGWNNKGNQQGCQGPFLWCEAIIGAYQVAGQYIAQARHAEQGATRSETPEDFHKYKNEAEKLWRGVAKSEALIPSYKEQASVAFAMEQQIAETAKYIKEMQKKGLTPDQARALAR
jgi:hypothetical protein